MNKDKFLESIEKINGVAKEMREMEEEQKKEIDRLLNKHAQEVIDKVIEYIEKHDDVKNKKTPLMIVTGDNGLNFMMQHVSDTIAKEVKDRYNIEVKYVMNQWMCTNGKIMLVPLTQYQYQLNQKLFVDGPFRQHGARHLMMESEVSAQIVK